MNFTRHRWRSTVVGCVAVLIGGCAAEQPGANHTVADGTTRAMSPPKSSTAQPIPMHHEVTIGTSVEGRPIILHQFGDAAVGREKTVLIFGGIHGSEPTSAGVCRELVTHLKSRPDLYRDRVVYVVPDANPDGLARKIRTNKNLIDLNRNFPAKNWKKTHRSNFFGGDAPATEPETIALIATIDRLQPARIVSVHSMDEPCNNYDGPGESIARAMALHNGYAVKASIGYPTPGSFGSWAGGDRKIPVITLELPHKGRTATSWEKNRGALISFIQG